MASESTIHSKPPARQAKLLAAKKLAASRKKQNDVVKDIFENAIQYSNIRRKSTGVVFDQLFFEHKCLWDEEHQERPERLKVILEKCEDMGLINRCLRLLSQPAPLHLIEMKHTSKHTGFLQNVCQVRDIDELEKNSSKFDAVYFHPKTYESSVLAAGCAIELVDNILSNKIQNGMALIRPPGHHAMESEYCGYCFFNNLAIAAEYALNNYNLKRILIVDWDVHHGQATQRMFYDDPRVLYFSIHRFEHGEFWPNLRESEFDNIGSGQGMGYNFNLPLNEIGMGDSEYLQIFNQVLLPVAFEYNPELVLVSSGYDAAIGCPEGEMNVSPTCYAHLVGSLMSLSSGKVAVVLEGGYCLQSLGESAAMTLRALLGDPTPSLTTISEPKLSVMDSIRNCIYAHKTFWKCFDYYDVYHMDEDITDNSESLRHMVTVKSVENLETVTEYPTRNTYIVQTKSHLENVGQKLQKLREITDFTVPNYRTCFVYDDKMLKHADMNSDHPENPNRIETVYKKLSEFGLLQNCKQIVSRTVTIRELLLVHSPQHIQNVWNTATMNSKKLIMEEKKLQSIYLNNHTFESASIAAGSILAVADEILLKHCRSGICIVRPPGHHAEANEPHGFCIFSNAAICANYVIKNYNLKKVLIVDWDVHHGNGTQNAFYDNKKVLYISLHRYDNGNFFPRGSAGNYTDIGGDGAKGFNVNIPWNKKGMKDAEYIMAFQQIVMPIAYEFNPELVIISAGFDAAAGDPLGGCKVSPEAYGHMTHMLTLLANSKTLITLEGGYNSLSTAYCMAMCTKALQGEPLPPLSLSAVDPTAISSIRKVIEIQSQYWTCLKGRHKIPAEDILNNKYFKQNASKTEAYHKNDQFETMNNKLQELSLKN